MNEELSRYVVPLAQFDGLALQAEDPRRIASFWHHNLPDSRYDAARLRLDPSPLRARAEILRLLPTSRLASDPARVHVDIRLPGGDPTALLAAGATVVREPGTDPWWVLADPEGNQFCGFPSVDERPAGVFELVVKCRDAHSLAFWWGRVLGGAVAHEGEAAVVSGAPDFPWDYMVFDPVPEPRKGPNRLHWHLILRDSDPLELVKLGATVLRRPGEPMPCPTTDGHWMLADPEGNEFCAVPADRDIP
ncbi:VOC family protein [Actinoplanes sp. TFC3]|uniref:VOC family protein n=1 Tax=Actinoplanes sp. TFC3 TaxID=1710355 RepID=UPI0012907FA8|nr:VOC family protein [Actinoplanes sp. TFC3]